MRFNSGIVLLFSGALAAGQTIDIGDRRQLLMDERWVRDARGVEFVVHQPRKTGDQSIVSQQGWELSVYHTVLEEGGRYHLWYTAGPGICYARSNDGVHWEKPDLDLTKVEGAEHNNLVLGAGAGGLQGRTHGLMVFLDPKAPPGERFRMVVNPGTFRSFLQIFSSPDGIRWKHTHRDVMVFDDTVKAHHLDTQNVVFWDRRLGRYVAYVRRNVREPGTQGRAVARAEAAELKFGHIEQTQVVFDANPVNIRHYDALRKAEAPVIDVYTNGAFQYPWADDAYFLFPALYYHYGPYQSEFKKEVPVNAGVLDVRFAASRDGIAWNRYDWRPYVPTGMLGEFDSRRIYMVYGVVPARNGRELYMYYVGTSDTHGWERTDKNRRILTAAGVQPGDEPSAISRVVLRRDGFVSTRAGREEGEFTTPPLRFHGQQLVLNIDTSALGEARVELLDEKGAPVPGFTLAECDIIHSANEISRPVKWKGASDVSRLAGKTIRVRFVLRNVDLFALQFIGRPTV